MSDAATVRLWHSMAFDDTDTMTTWLAAVGFVEHATYRDDDGTVRHAEWLWPGGGGLMFGARAEGAALDGTGPAAAYLVCDDPDAVFDDAVGAGATFQRPMVEQDDGVRGGSVLDPEGNLWSFGSYQPS